LTFEEKIACHNNRSGTYFVFVFNHYLCSSAAQQTIRNQAKIGAFNALTRRENSFLIAKNDLVSVTEYPKKENFTKILPF